MSESEDQFEGAPEATADMATPGATEGGSDDASTPTPVAAAMRELDTISDRDLAVHPDVYQRIHTELQAALTTIDDA